MYFPWTKVILICQKTSRNYLCTKWIQLKIKCLSCVDINVIDYNILKYHSFLVLGGGAFKKWKWWRLYRGLNIFFFDAAQSRTFTGTRAKIFAKQFAIGMWIARRRNVPSQVWALFWRVLPVEYTISDSAWTKTFTMVSGIDINDRMSCKIWSKICYFTLG